MYPAYTTSYRISGSKVFSKVWTTDSWIENSCHSYGISTNQIKQQDSSSLFSISGKSITEGQRYSGPIDLKTMTHLSECDSNDT